MSGSFSPLDPAYEVRVRDSFARQGFMGLLGTTMSRIEPGRCELRLDYRDEHSQQHGFFHGGVVGALADTAGGYAGFSLMAAEDSVLTVEYKLNLVAPAAGERLIARGEVMRAGRTLTVTRADVFVHRAGEERLVATALQTLMRLAGRSDGPA